MSEIAVQLGRLRVERHLTQQELADRIEVRRDTISALERGKSQGIEFGTLARLCDALACTPNDLLDVSPKAHVVPVLGGEDEDAIIAERLATVDLDALIANPALVGAVAGDDRTTPAQAAIVVWDVSPDELRAQLPNAYGQRPPRALGKVIARGEDEGVVWDASIADAEASAGISGEARVADRASHASGDETPPKRPR